MALNSGGSLQNQTTSRLLNKLNAAIGDIMEDVTTATTSDIVLMLDADDSYTLKYGDATNVKELIGIDGQTATVAEVNRVADASARVVATTATTLAVTAATHGERLILINTNNASGCTVSLPAASGTGNRYEIVNNIAQTQGSLVIAANGTDVMTGIAYVVNSTGTSSSVTFVTTATSDKFTWNRTTTGGIQGDRAVLWDTAANTWTVEVHCNASGSLATPFAAS